MKRISKIILCAVLLQFAFVFPAPAHAYDTGMTGRYQTISAGGSSAAIRSGGDLMAWGYNRYGFLGGRPPEESNYSIQTKPVTIMNNAVAVGAGADHIMAIKTDGSLWGCGDNGNGQLGFEGGDSEDGDPPVQTVPRKVTDHVTAVSAGDIHTLAIKTDGSLWAWGWNEFGQLGDGTETDRHTPVKVMDGVVAAGAGANHSMAVKADGSLWVWGLNEYGQLGFEGGVVHRGILWDGATVQPTPKKLMDGVTAVCAGDAYGMAIKTDGSLWAWGWNANGQLGFEGGNAVGETYAAIVQPTPKKVMDDVKAISAGDDFAMAIKTDGSLWAWGRNDAGQVGDGTTTDRYTPVKVMDGVVAAGAGGAYSMAVRADGSLWIWGANDAGELGVEESFAQTSPTKLMDGIMLPGRAASPSGVAVLLDGKETAFDAYNIDGNNYFKLRDLAGALNGTAAEFSVSYDGAAKQIRLQRGEAYTPDGSGTEPKIDGNKTATPSFADLLVDGEPSSLTAYSIGGNNYYKLRDLAEILGFGVEWDAGSRTVRIDTGIAAP
jgi:alpha-tubulin suppressor-like RCC1 family protein